MAKKQKPEQKTTAHMSKYADVLTGAMVEVPGGQEPPTTNPIPMNFTVVNPETAQTVPPGALYQEEPPLRQLPKGFNKFNSTNEFLMLILESLYRIERKMGV